MLITTLEAVPNETPAKNNPVHKPCDRESEAARPISGDIHISFTRWWNAASMGKNKYTINIQ